MKKTSLCFAAVFAVLFGFFVASCSGGADSPNLTLYMQPSGGSSDSGGGTQTPTPTPMPTPPAEYNVTYVITNGSDDMTGESRSSGKYTAQSELTIPQKEGFVFKGWYSDQEQTQAVASFAGLTGDVTLYGHWAGTLYTVVIEGIDGATLAEGAVAVAGFSTEDTTLSLPAYTKRFYAFEGLYLDSEFNGTAVTQIGKDSAEAGSRLTLYAKWTEKVYTVNYDLLFDSGVTNPNTIATVTASTGGALDAPTYTDSDFVFAGWYANYNCGIYSNQVTELPVDGIAGDDNSFTLHAKWTHATPWTPSGATVRVTSMQTVANDIAALTAEGEEFYLLVTDNSIERRQFRDVNAALKVNTTTNFYFDFSAATTAFGMEGGNGTYSFYESVNFTGITLPECPAFITLERCVFKGSSLKVVKIPDQITKICDSLFMDCAELEIVYLPKNLSTVERNVFKNCAKLKKTYYNSTSSDWLKINFDATEYSKPTCYGGAVYVWGQEQWEKLYQVYYDLLFESGVTNPNSAITVTASTGCTLAAPSYTDRDYIFSGWFKSCNNGKYSNQVTELSVENESGESNLITLHAKWTHVTADTPSGATVQVTSRQTMPNDIAVLATAREEFYLVVTDDYIDSYSLSNIVDALKANSNGCFYLDFKAVKKIDWFTYGFIGCNNITGIVLSTKEIKRNTVRNCTSLKKIHFYAVPKVEGGAFSDCSQLKETYCHYTYSYLKTVDFDADDYSKPTCYGGALYFLNQDKTNWERAYTISYDRGGIVWSNGYIPPMVFCNADFPVLPTAENISRTGYDFGGWYSNNKFTGDAYTSVPDGASNNVKYWAKWIAKNDTPYKVLHYQQNLDDSDYSLYETENLTGTTDSYVVPASKNYPGFTSESVSRQKINGNGSTEIKIYYKRKTATLTIDLAGGTLDGKTGVIARSGKYGASVPALSNPQKTNYTFMGWNTNGGALPSVYAEDATFTAVWLLNEVRGIDITVDPLSDISVTKSQSGNTVTFTAQECDSYSWTLDGAAKGSARTCSIDTSTLLKGTYTLTLEAKKGGKWFSYTAQIKVN